MLDSGPERRGTPSRKLLWRTDLNATFERNQSAVATRALRGISVSFGLVLLGLFVNLFTREEVYTSIEYGFPLLALFGAAGCIGQLTVSISRRSGVLASACCIPINVLRATFVRDRVPGHASGLPVLMALLFGPFFVLLAGLGGWV